MQASASLEQGKAWDEQSLQTELQNWTREWSDRRDVYPTEPQGDSVAVARALWQQVPGRPPHRCSCRVVCGSAVKRWLPQSRRPRRRAVHPSGSDSRTRGNVSARGFSWRPALRQ